MVPLDLLQGFWLIVCDNRVIVVVAVPSSSRLTARQVGTRVGKSMHGTHFRHLVSLSRVTPLTWKCGHGTGSLSSGFIPGRS